MFVGGVVGLVTSPPPDQRRRLLESRPQETKINPLVDTVISAAPVMGLIATGTRSQTRMGREAAEAAGFEYRKSGKR